MFRRYFISSWASYAVLATLTYVFKLYEYFPGTGFLGYGLVITLLLFALYESTRSFHYLLVGASLVLFGAIASLDIILSEHELAAIWFLWDWFPLSGEHVKAYVQIMIILLNIFTGSLAANCLFHGLNKKNFDK